MIRKGSVETAPLLFFECLLPKLSADKCRSICTHRFGRYLFWPLNRLPTGDITATFGGFRPMLPWGVDSSPWCANHLPSGKSILLSRNCFMLLSDDISRVHEGSSLLVHAVIQVWTLLMNYLSKQSLKRVLRQSRVLNWLRSVPFSDSSYCADSSLKWLCLLLAQKPCDTHTSEVYWCTECQALTDWGVGQYFPPYNPVLKASRQSFSLTKAKYFILPD